jgi:hypothetical protein
MNRQTLSDALLLAGPVFGLTMNVIVQFTVFRAGWRGLLGSIVVGFFAGAGVAAGFVVAAAETSPLVLFDALALAVVVLVVYGAAGFAYFAFVNLGETSLRIRMLQLVADAPRGLTVADILAVYNDRDLFAIRLGRMAENDQALIIGDRFYPRRSVLFTASVVLEFLKRLLYGARRKHL